VTADIFESIRAAVDGQYFTYSERDVLKLVDEPLKRLKAAPAEEQVAFVFEALKRLQRGESLQVQLALKSVSSSLLRAGLPLSTIEGVQLVELVSARKTLHPYKAILTALENIPKTPALRHALLNLRPAIDEWHGGPQMRELHERIDVLLNGAAEKPLVPANGWSQEVFREIDASPKQFEWRALLLHARSLTQSMASRKWQVEAVSRIERIGRSEFLDAAGRWLALGPMPGTTQVQVPDAEADYQKGFIWALGALGDTTIAPAIADFAFACFRKIPMVGAVSHRVGNACVNALAAMTGLDAVAQISRLAARVKYDVARRLIEKALADAATCNNVSREDLEAMSVPRFELDANGAPVVNGNKKAAKEMEGVVSSLRIRLERQLLSQSACPRDRWKEWYLDHPVTSYFAKRLIWEIESAGATWTAIWFEGEMVDWAGAVVELPPEAKVRLWHPIRSDVQTVLSWRCWLEDHGVRQPFKQAHREIYVLTDAERQTETYSNRFGAHVIRQHQFAALCRERGWQFNLMGQWDSHNTPYLDLPQYNLRAEFDVEFPHDEAISGHAVYLEIGTGRVQFLPLGKQVMALPLRLQDIPAVVFSEVMRDCDLFVGVTSIGMDPAWNTQHPDGAYAEYWQSFAFGDLTTASENRRSVVENLLPKLAIRDRCRLEGRCLVVRGDLHEYHIHLGSGSVLLEPGSRYLCIVQGAGDTAANVPLPFEGDRTLALILSKAFLLVNDKKIKDETIRRQL